MFFKSLIQYNFCSWEPLGAKAGDTPPILPQPLQELAADPRLEPTELWQFKFPSLGKGSHLGKYLLFKFDIFFNTLDNLGFFSFFQPGIAEMISVLGGECVHHSRQNFLNISSLLSGLLMLKIGKLPRLSLSLLVFLLTFWGRFFHSPPWNPKKIHSYSAPPMPELFLLMRKDQWGRKVDRPSYRDG